VVRVPTHRTHIGVPSVGTLVQVLSVWIPVHVLSVETITCLLTKRLHQFFSYITPNKPFSTAECTSMILFIHVTMKVCLNILVCIHSVETSKWVPVVTGHFAYGTLRLLDSSPTVWSFHLLDTLPTGHFAYETFRLLDISPTRHFAYCLDSSPTDITHLILFYSGNLVGKMKSNL